MPRNNLGPWGKLYASTDTDTAYYTDRQFRVWISVFCQAIYGRGEVPKIEALRARYGAEDIDFLVEDRRIRVRRGGRVEVLGWDVYQAKTDPTAADRMRRYRGRHAEPVTQGQESLDPVDPPFHTQPLRVTERNVSSSVSTSQSPRSNGVDDGLPIARGYDVDAWVALSSAVDELTGRPYSLKQPTSGLGETALGMASAFGLASAVGAIRRVGMTTPHADPSQLILGANRLLRPIPGSKDVRDREDSATERRRAETARAAQSARDAEYREWVDDGSGLTTGTARRQGSPARIGDLLGAAPQDEAHLDD